MTSTNMFQGLDEGSKPSSRVLRPPGGGSSNIFGGCEDASASRRPNKMASTVFAPPEESQGSPKRSNPPGGKSSGIFAAAEVPSSQVKPNPPGGATNNIFGGTGTSPPVKSSHPNKPKDNIGVSAVPFPDLGPQQKSTEQVKQVPVAQATPTKEKAPSTPTSTATPDAEPSPNQQSEKDHEPRLGPRPRSHNRVLNPPGGKSSVVFY